MDQYAKFYKKLGAKFPKHYFKKNNKNKVLELTAAAPASDYYVIIEDSMERKELSTKVLEWIKADRIADKSGKKLLLVIQEKHKDACKKLLKTWRINGQILCV